MHLDQYMQEPTSFNDEILPLILVSIVLFALFFIFFIWELNSDGFRIQ